MGAFRAEDLPRAESGTVDSDREKPRRGGERPRFGRLCPASLAQPPVRS